MTLEDLQRIKLALTTGTDSYFHGDMNGAFLKVVEELIELKTRGVADIEAENGDSNEDKRMKIKLIEHIIEIDTPEEGEIVKLDFNGHFLAQCIFVDNTFLFTGTSIDGNGNDLPHYFYRDNKIEIVINDSTKTPEEKWEPVKKRRGRIYDKN